MVKSTIFFVVAVAWTNAVVGGQYIHRTPEWTTDAWAECFTVLDAPTMSHLIWPWEGSLDGTTWKINQDTVTVTRGDSIYSAGWFYSNEQVGCNRSEGTWTWTVYRSGDTTNLTPWIHPGLLSQDGQHTLPQVNPDLTVDAADAATLFRLWETPAADITGDGWTDAADAGRLFELWTGDVAPSSVPEPAGAPALLALLPLLLRQRNDIVSSLNPEGYVWGGIS